MTKWLVVAAMQVGLVVVSAQVPSPNQAGVAMGHLHYKVRDVDANKRFWVALGGTPIKVGTTEVVRFPDVMVFLTPGESSGGSEGAVVNHVAFRVKTLTQVEAAGLKVDRLAGFPGVASTMTPEKERIELFEDAALNLGFTPDAGRSDPVAERHNRPLSSAVAFHHVHLYLPGEAPAEAKAWYTRLFGGIPGKRSQYDAVDLPGINFNFNGGRQAAAPTKGRMLDHIGFEVRNLEAFCRRLESMGIKLDVPFQKGPDGVSLAGLTDPWGTSIELTEGLNAF